MFELKGKNKDKKIARKYNNKGITLIVLVITIIILLILAGVVINFVINGGILDKARTSNR